MIFSRCEYEQLDRRMAVDFSRIDRSLQTLYGARAASCRTRLLELIEKYARPHQQNDGWDERDIVLITYGDQVQSAADPPLSTLRQFLLEHRLQQLINIVHLLPFFPYSSDDGFAVIDYRQVDPNLGSWDDIERLRVDFDLMFDLVVNHVSSQSGWFQSYLKGEEPFTHFFIECDPKVDLSAVTRPRSLPLLTCVDTNQGPRHVWTTFSHDQIDLDFGEPDVLIEMLDVLLLYAKRGARIIRLDAIAYLWKRLGSNCIHLDQTHEVVKIMRRVLQAAAPNVLILTETNVPHAENVSYFGDGDEAQMVYQFSLPPLLLDAFVHQDAQPLRNWLRGLEAPKPGTTYFNFTASHDGIGVRPLEGLIDADRLASLVQHVERRGGRVSNRANPDGTDSPYELNVAYVDALADDSIDVDQHARRFLATQAVMLALQGIPGVYFHSLVGSRNDIAGMEQTNQPRRINRRKYDVSDLALRLAGDPLQSRIFSGYQQLLKNRVRHKAFHPDASQRVADTAEPELLAFARTSVDGTETILSITNFGNDALTVDLSSISPREFELDLISNTPIQNGSLQLPAGTTAWLS